MGCSPRSPGHYRLDTMGDADTHRGVPHPASSGHGEVNLGELGSYMQHMPSCISMSWARIRLAADVRRAAQASSRAGMSGSSLDPTTRSPPAGTCSLRLPVRATRFMSIHARRDGGGIACSAVRRRVETCATKTASKLVVPGQGGKKSQRPSEICHLGKSSARDDGGAVPATAHTRRETDQGPANRPDTDLPIGFACCCNAAGRQKPQGELGGDEVRDKTRR